MSRLIDAYIAELDHGVIRSGERRRPEFTRKVKARLEIIRARWGNRPAESIKRSDISALLDDFNSRPPTQRVMQATINALFAFLSDRYEVAHPGRGMKQRGGSRECVRYLDSAELRLAIPTMRALGYPRGSVMSMALYTGRRVNEITGMEWSEVDMANGLHQLPAARSKNHRAHVLPLSAWGSYRMPPAERSDPADMCSTAPRGWAGTFLLSIPTPRCPCQDCGSVFARYSRPVRSRAARAVHNA